MVNCVSSKRVIYWRSSMSSRQGDTSALRKAVPSCFLRTIPNLNLQMGIGRGSHRSATYREFHVERQSRTRVTVGPTPRPSMRWRAGRSISTSQLRFRWRVQTPVRKTRPCAFPAERLLWYLDGLGALYGLPARLAPSCLGHGPRRTRHSGGAGRRPITGQFRPVDYPSRPLAALALDQ
jgi:hypothetical protein